MRYLQIVEVHILITLIATINIQVSTLVSKSTPVLRLPAGRQA